MTKIVATRVGAGLDMFYYDVYVGRDNQTQVGGGNTDMAGLEYQAKINGKRCKLVVDGKVVVTA